MHAHVVGQTYIIYDSEKLYITEDTFPGLKLGIGSPRAYLFKSVEQIAIFCLPFWRQICCGL
jgi:hypothetical protein